MSSAAAQSTLENLLKEKSPPKELLQHIQDHKLHEPAVVLENAQFLLRAKLSPSQRLTLLEQITIAAIHEKDTSIAEECLIEIKSTPGVGSTSLRYRKLLALCLESESEFDQALQIYDDMIADNPANMHALKRKYAILRSQLNDVEARKCLNAYLEQNANDASSWFEMAKCCLEQGDYKGAAFCYEEVVLFSPTDPHVHCVLGELYVTIGGKENYILARKHFAQCLELDRSCCRALFGLVSATESHLDLMESDSKRSKDYDEDDVEMVRELHKYGVENLMKSYKGTHIIGLLEGLF